MRFCCLLILCLLMPFKATWAENMASARADNPMAVQAAKSHHDHCVDAARGDTKSGCPPVMYCLKTRTVEPVTLGAPL
jgi:hypothetical protein